MDELRIGAAMLREAVAVDAERNERVARAREIEKAAADTAKRNVCYASLYLSLMLRFSSLCLGSTCILGRP
jgi:hypothetical protein